MEIKSKINNFLLWSEKYIQTDMVYLAKGGFWLTSGQIISVGITLLLSIAFANLLPPATYGVYKFLLSIVGILTVFTLHGINSAVTQAVAQGYEGSLISGLKSKLRWGSLGSLAALGIFLYYFLRDNDTLASGFLIAALFVPFFETLTIYFSYLTGKKAFKSSAKYKIMGDAVLALILISVLFITKNPLLILFVYLAITTISRFVFLKLTLKNFPPNKEENPQTIPYGKHLSLMGVIKVVAGNLDSILIWHFLNPISLAVYNFALLPVLQISATLQNLSALALPKFSTAAEGEIKSRIFNKTIRFSLFLMPFVLGYMIFAPLLYKLIFPQYSDSVFYSQIFALSILLAPSILLSTFLQAKMKTKQLYLLQLLTPLSQIVFLLILLPAFGITGAVFSLLCAQIFNFILATILIKTSF